MGVHCNFVSKMDQRHLWTENEENYIMTCCGEIFKRHFGGKDVGYDEMIAKKRQYGLDNVQIDSRTIHVASVHLVIWAMSCIETMMQPGLLLCGSTKRGTSQSHGICCSLNGK